jgi:hypothetical protein
MHTFTNHDTKSTLGSLAQLVASGVFAGVLLLSQA